MLMQMQMQNAKSMLMQMQNVECKVHVDANAECKNAKSMLCEVLEDIVIQSPTKMMDVSSMALSSLECFTPLPAS